MFYLRQGTLQAISIGPFVNNAGVGQGGLTIAAADRKLSKSGGVFAGSNFPGNAVHDVDGWYRTSLDSIDTNTVGQMFLEVPSIGSAFPMHQEYTVLTQAAYDAFYGNTANPISPIEALFDTIIPELSQSTPPITPTFAEAVMMNYMIQRNNSEADSGERRYKNAADVVVFKATILDDTITLRQGTLVTGP